MRSAAHERRRAIYAVCVWSATSRTFAEKFHWLGEPFADAALRAEIINAVEHLEEISIAELAGLLGAVSPTAQRPRTRGRL
jgi:hypothetical protein